MKITVEHTESGENEVILRCREVDDEMLRLLALIRAGMQKLLVWNPEKEMLPLNIAEVVYCETVEEKTFVYTERGMYQTRPDTGGIGGSLGDNGTSAVQ